MLLCSSITKIFEQNLPSFQIVDWSARGFAVCRDVRVKISGNEMDRWKSSKSFDIHTPISANTLRPVLFFYRLSKCIRRSKYACKVVVVIFVVAAVAVAIIYIIVVQLKNSSFIEMNHVSSNWFCWFDWANERYIGSVFKLYIVAVTVVLFVS